MFLSHWLIWFLLAKLSSYWNMKYLDLCFVKSLPWQVIEIHGLKISFFAISFLKSFIPILCAKISRTNKALKRHILTRNFSTNITFANMRIRRYKDADNEVQLYFLRLIAVHKKVFPKRPVSRLYFYDILKYLNIQNCIKKGSIFWKSHA